MDRDPRLGSVVAGCRIEAVIGRGGMGIVYLAEHLTLGRRVAVKLLPVDRIDDDQYRSRMLRESRAAAMLDHPNVIDVHDAGTDEGHLYVVMRYVEGDDLRTVLAREGRLDVERTLGIIEQVASALDAAHDAGLLHRDVKPANIFLAPGHPEHAFLGDFGLSRLLDADSELTETGTLVGTTEYLAPELWEGSEASPRSDAYALGCVLFECLTGRRPFDRDSPAAIIRAVLLDPPPSVRTTHPDLEGFDAVFAHALAKDPAGRFATCSELAGAAWRAVEHLPVDPEAVALVPAAEPPLPEPRVRGRPPARTWTWWLRPIAAAGAAIGIVYALRASEGPPSSPRPMGAAVLPASAGSYLVYAEPDGPVRWVPAAEASRTHAMGSLLRAAGPGREEWAVPTRDGRRLLVSSTRFGCADWACLALVGADGSAADTVRSGGEPLHAAGAAAVSDDASVIVFQSTDGPHEADLWVTRTLGAEWTEPALVTSVSAHAYHGRSSIAPGGGRIVFECGPRPYQGDGTGICEAGPDGAGFREVVRPEQGPGGTPVTSVLAHPAVAPDGALVFAADWGRIGSQLWRLVPGADPVRLTRRGRSYAPCVLADGRIAAVWVGASGAEIRLWSADGATSTRVASLRGNEPQDLACAG